MKKIYPILKILIKIILLLGAIGLFIFALLSGAEVGGLLKNFPNSWPWLVLLVFVLLSFWREVWGGLLVILFGLFTIFFFNALEFTYILFVISLPLIVLGSIILLTHFIGNSN